LERNLLKYIWKHSRPQQAWLFVVILSSMPLYFMSLDLPKRIVNGPIQGNGFDSPGDVYHFLAFDLPYSQYFFGEPISVFSGFELSRTGTLIALCFAFLTMVFVNGWFKLYINTYKGRLGERLLRRLRYELFDRVLRYPVQKIRQVKPSEITSVIKDEVDPLSEFIGDAFSLPMFLGGQAITGLTFLFLQNYFFGILTLGIVLFQAWLVPRLRRRLLVLGRERQTSARRMAGRIGELVQSMDDVHLNDTSNLHRAQLSGMLGKIYHIRFELYQRKFAVKFINNFLIQFLAFLFYAVGGYFVITGRMDIGALVASIAAYKDLPTPIKGLIDWDQLRLLNQVRYTQAIDDISKTQVSSPQRQAVPDNDVPNIGDGFSADNVSVLDYSGTPIIDGVGVKIRKGERVALVGDSRSGVDRFAEVLAGLLPGSSGHLYVDGRDIEELPESLTGRRIAYVNSNTFFPAGTILEILTEVLMNQPNKEPVAKNEHHAFVLDEADQAGNFVAEVTPGWVDRKRIGVSSDSEFEAWIVKVMRVAALYDDILQFGIRRHLNTNEPDEVREKLVETRNRFAGELAGSGLESLVELFDPDKYNQQMSIGENIIFGMAKDESFEIGNLLTNDVFREILNETGAEERLFEIGVEIAKTNIELFGDLDENSPLLEQAGALPPERLAELSDILERLSGKKRGSASKKEREKILALPFDYVERESRFGLVDEDAQKMLLGVRKALRERLERDESDAIAFHDPGKYNPSVTILDNILFGRIDTRRVGGRDRVINAIMELVNKLELNVPVFHAGLGFDIGTGARNLSESQSQKLRLARALFKKPDILILNRAMGALDLENRREVMDNLFALLDEPEMADTGLIFIPVDPNLANRFGRVIKFERGRVVSDGPPDTVGDTGDAVEGVPANAK
jgi:putative ABC transport system ATP-binding protein